MLKLLFIGDIVGRPGREIVADRVPRLRQEHGIDRIGRHSKVLRRAHEINAGATTGRHERVPARAGIAPEQG